MTSEQSASLSVAVVSFTQIIKWLGLKDHYGPWVVIGLSTLATMIEAWSLGDFGRVTVISYIVGWIVVMTSAAGVYGFTRATVDAVNGTAAVETCKCKISDLLALMGQNTVVPVMVPPNDVQTGHGNVVGE